MRRQIGTAERDTDGSWKIASDHLTRAAEFERSQFRSAPVTVEPLSLVSLHRQIGADGPTWLDRTLKSAGDHTYRDAGFGREVNAALKQRAQWLIEQGLANHVQGSVVVRPEAIQILNDRELASAGRSIAQKTGLRYAEPGSKIDGIYKRSIDLASGKFAVIETSREFTLVPWRPVLERYLGKAVVGIGRGDSVSWSLRRDRSRGIT
jgi:hypothetical protein